jgi:drug/metabolite transporter (DMT)-like permease
MTSLLLLLTVTVLYAGYNLLIKVSGAHVPADATTTIVATICLQLAALATSGLVAALLLLRGGHVLQLSSSAYLWAAAAGLCIGGAEIAYFYLFGGIGATKPIAANLAIPTIVAGTIVITMLVAYFLFKEPLGWRHLLGIGLIVSGILVLFVRDGPTAS